MCRMEDTNASPFIDNDDVLNETLDGEDAIETPRDDDSDGSHSSRSSTALTSTASAAAGMYEHDTSGSSPASVQMHSIMADATNSPKQEPEHVKRSKREKQLETQLLQQKRQTAIVQMQMNAQVAKLVMANANASAPPSPQGGAGGGATGKRKTPTTTTSNKAKRQRIAVSMKGNRKLSNAQRKQLKPASTASSTTSAPEAKPHTANVGQIPKKSHSSTIARSDSLQPDSDDAIVEIDSMLSALPGGAGPKCSACKHDLYCGSCGCGQFRVNGPGNTLINVASVSPTMTEPAPLVDPIFEPYNGKFRNNGETAVIQQFCHTNFAYERCTDLTSFACFRCSLRILPDTEANGITTILAESAVLGLARVPVYCTRCCHAVYCSTKCKQYDLQRHSKHGCKLAWFYPGDV